MGYDSTLKRKEILILATVEDILLSEISQSQKDKYCTVPLTGGTCLHKDRK